MVFQDWKPSFAKLCAAYGIGETTKPQSGKGSLVSWAGITFDCIQLLMLTW